MKTDSSKVVLFKTEKDTLEGTPRKGRRNSFTTTQDQSDQEVTVKQEPKSVGGDIDNLISSISKIALTPETTSTSMSTLIDKKKSPKPAMVNKVIKRSPSTSESDKQESEDELSQIKASDIEHVAASYISSMKEILSSFDRTLQMAGGVKEIMSKRAQKPMTDKKDTALPLPRFLISGGKNGEAVKIPTKIDLEEAKSARKTENKDQTGGVKKGESKPSPTTPIVDDKEAPPTRRLRSRTNPTEEGHILRSSKQALPRRRYLPDQVESFPYQYSNVNEITGLSQDVTYDGMLATNSGFQKQQDVSQVEYYAYPDHSTSINVNMNNMAYNTNNVISPVEGYSSPYTQEASPDAGLGVYSSPVAPLTPPGGSFSMTGNMSSPQYSTPQDLSYYTPESMTYSNWSAPSSNVGSPPPQQLLSPQRNMSLVLQPHSIIEMKRHILVPLAQDHSLMQFTSLIAAASHRLDEGRIVCLRDLEKFLLFKSQEMAPSSDAFLIFCERLLIRCQASIPYIESVGGELTRPNDMPYYDGYFLDVLSQHKGAMSMQNVPAPMVIMRRETAPASSSSKKSVVSSSRISKNHSVSHISHASISAGMHEQILAAVMQQASQEVKLGLAPAFSEQFNMAPQAAFPPSPNSDDREGHDFGTDEDDAVHHNMSSNLTYTKKKRLSAQKPLGGHVCMHRDEESGVICGKKYNRPCDLKKHGKTHSRPHKCSETTCLYHEKGFPTEKERDRHETDRHSDSPVMFQCEFPPCPYKSKRESNCKQHMEKQHDYVYERSKHNPRNPNGNADISKRTSMSQSPIIPSSESGSQATALPYNKMNGLGATSIFDNGISTPPTDFISNFFPSAPLQDSKIKVQNMYMTPSPENSQTYRSGSVPTSEIMEQDHSQYHNDNNGNAWGYNTWQPMTTQSMDSYAYGMTSAE